MKAVLLMLALPIALVAQEPADTGVRAIRLDEAVRLAQQNAPTAVQARGELRTSRAQVRSAYASFIPNVTLSASAGRQGGDRFDSQGNLVPFTGNSWQMSHGLGVNVDLFDGGQRIFGVRATKAQVNASAANEVTQQYEVALQVKQQFFAVLAAGEAEAAARSQLAEAEQQLATSTAMLHARTATRSDSLRAVIQVGNARLALLTALNDRQTADAALTRLVGTSFPVTASPADTVAETQIELDSAALAALVQDAPLVRQAVASEVAAHASSKAARGPYLPTLSLSWNYSGNRSDDGLGGLAGQYAYQNSLRLGLSYPLFNQLNREEGIVRADVAERNAEATLRDTKLQARQSLIQYLGALRTAQEQMQIQTASVAAAEEDLRVQKQRYQLGASLQLDVLTSETALVQARAALIQARYDYRVAKAQLEALIGRDL
ncbi:MAG TPA: TolC family protein [Gemmatimonadaceae bacterium]|jgi:Outer membrane protein